MSRARNSFKLSDDNDVEITAESPDLKPNYTSRMVEKSPLIIGKIVTNKNHMTNGVTVINDKKGIIPVDNMKDVRFNLFINIVFTKTK